MKPAVSLVLSFVLVIAGLACNREDPPPPTAKVTSASPDLETPSIRHQTSALVGTWTAGFWVDSGFVPAIRTWPQRRYMSKAEFADYMQRSKRGEVITPKRLAIKDIPPQWFGGKAVPDTWYGYSGFTGTQFAVHTPGAMEVGDPDQGYQWVLEIDQTTPDGSFDGILFTQEPQGGELAVTVKKHSPEWSDITAYLGPLFDQEEDRVIQDPKSSAGAPGRIRPSLGHPRDPQVRKQSDLHFDLARIPLNKNGNRLYRFEMTRTYREGNAMPWLTQLTGWLLRSRDGKVSLVEKSIVLDDGDSQLTTSITPVSVVRLNERTFVLSHERGYEWSAVSLSEWDGSHLVPGNSFTLESK